MRDLLKPSSIIEGYFALGELMKLDDSWSLRCCEKIDGAHIGIGWNRFGGPFVASRNSIPVFLNQWSYREYIAVSRGKSYPFSDKVTEFCAKIDERGFFALCEHAAKRMRVDHIEVMGDVFFLDLCDDSAEGYRFVKTSYPLSRDTFFMHACKPFNQTIWESMLCEPDNIDVKTLFQHGVPHMGLRAKFEHAYKQIQGTNRRAPIIDLGEKIEPILLEMGRWVTNTFTKNPEGYVFNGPQGSAVEPIKAVEPWWRESKLKGKSFDGR